MLSGAPGTFSSSQRPVHPSSTARRGRFRGSGGGNTTGERSDVRGQESLAFHYSVPPSSSSPSRSVSIMLDSTAVLGSPEVQRVATSKPRPGSGGSRADFRRTPLQGAGTGERRGQLDAREGRAEVSTHGSLVAALVTAFSAPRRVIAPSPLSAASAGATRDRGSRLPPPQVRLFPPRSVPFFPSPLFSPFLLL